jgi:hypothetical protein
MCYFMDKPYDGLMKMLVRRNPQAFLDLLYPGSRFVRFHDTKLGNTQRQPDAMIEARWPETGAHFLAQPEFQTYPDSKIAERQLLYRALILWQPEQELKKLPVWCKTLNLTKEPEGYSSPLRLTIPGPDGEQVSGVEFHCESCKMTDWTPEEILDLGHPELAVLLVAARGGATRETAELMIARTKEDPELLLGGFTIAELIFRVNGQKDLHAWFEKRRQTVLTDDPLIKDSGLYRDLVAIGRAEGEANAAAQIQQAKAEAAKAAVAIQQANAAAQQAKMETEAAKAQAQAAKAQAQAQAEAWARAKAEEAMAKAEEEAKAQQTIFQLLAHIRQGVLRLVLKRFRALAEFANDLVATISNPDLLQDLLTKLALAESTEEAEQHLRSVQAMLA